MSRVSQVRMQQIEWIGSIGRGESDESGDLGESGE